MSEKFLSGTIKPKQTTYKIEIELSPFDNAK